MFLGTAALFSFALVCGGLGPHAPLLGGLIEAAAFPLLVAVVVFGRSHVSSGVESVPAILFVLLLLAVGLSQLVPLPASAWAALPGRDVPGMTFETLGLTDRPHPLSLAPEDTRLVIQSWLPPVTIFLATLIASDEDRRKLALLAVLAAGLSSLLGLCQLSFGTALLFVDPVFAAGRYPGTFANINHQATFLACAVGLLPALTSATPNRRGVSWWWAAVFWVLALLGTLVTTSRAGLALFTAASCVSAARLWRAANRRRKADLRPRRGANPWPLLSSAAVLALVGAVVAGGYRAELMSSRFEQVDQDARFGFWSTTVVAIRTYAPFGAGLGTFESAYQIAEPLESVQSYIVNHAHNDYLEFTLETGVAGVLLIALFILWFGHRVYGLARGRGGSGSLGWSGATIIVLVMLHSLVDYPLRTEAIGCLFGFACALMLDPRATSVSGLRTGDVARGRRVAA